MWSEQNGMENSSHSDLLSPHLPMPLWLGTQTEPKHPQGPQLHWGEVTARLGMGPWLSVREQDTAQRPPASQGLLFLLIHKAILFLSEIWLDIYTHTNIYINISIYTGVLLH